MNKIKTPSRRLLGPYLSLLPVAEGYATGSLFVSSGIFTGNQYLVVFGVLFVFFAVFYGHWINGRMKHEDGRTGTGGGN